MPLLLWNDDSWQRIPTCRPQLPPRNKTIIQRSRTYIKWQIGGRVKLMRHKHVIKTFCTKVEWLRSNKNDTFFFKVHFFLAFFFLSSLLFFLSPFLALVSFPLFFFLHFFLPYISWSLSGTFCKRQMSSTCRPTKLIHNRGCHCFIPGITW